MKEEELDSPPERAAGNQNDTFYIEACLKWGFTRFRMLYQNDGALLQHPFCLVPEDENTYKLHDGSQIRSFFTELLACFKDAALRKKALEFLQIIFQRVFLSCNKCHKALVGKFEKNYNVFIAISSIERELDEFQAWRLARLCSVFLAERSCRYSMEVEVASQDDVNSLAAVDFETRLQQEARPFRGELKIPKLRSDFVRTSDSSPSLNDEKAKLIHLSEKPQSSIELSNNFSSFGGLEASLKGKAAENAVPFLHGKLINKEEGSCWDKRETSSLVRVDSCRTACTACNPGEVLENVRSEQQSSVILPLPPSLHSTAVSTTLDIKEGAKFEANSLPSSTVKVDSAALANMIQIVDLDCGANEEFTRLESDAMRFTRHTPLPEEWPIDAGPIYLDLTDDESYEAHEAHKALSEGVKMKPEGSNTNYEGETSNCEKLDSSSILKSSIFETFASPSLWMCPLEDQSNRMLILSLLKKALDSWSRKVFRLLCLYLPSSPKYHENMKNICNLNDSSAVFNLQGNVGSTGNAIFSPAGLSSTGLATANIASTSLDHMRKLQSEELTHTRASPAADFLLHSPSTKSSGESLESHRMPLLRPIFPHKSSTCPTGHKVVGTVYSAASKTSFAADLHSQAHNVTVGGIEDASQNLSFDRTPDFAVTRDGTAGGEAFAGFPFKGKEGVAEGEKPHEKDCVTLLPTKSACYAESWRHGGQRNSDESRFLPSYESSTSAAEKQDESGNFLYNEADHEQHTARTSFFYHPSLATELKHCAGSSSVPIIDAHTKEDILKTWTSLDLLSFCMMLNWLETSRAIAQLQHEDMESFLKSIKGRSPADCLPDILSLSLPSSLPSLDGYSKPLNASESASKSIMVIDIEELCESETGSIAASVSTGKDSPCSFVKAREVNPENESAFSPVFNTIRRLIFGDFQDPLYLFELFTLFEELNRPSEEAVASGLSENNEYQKLLHMLVSTKILPELHSNLSLFKLIFSFLKTKMRKVTSFSSFDFSSGKDFQRKVVDTPKPSKLEKEEGKTCVSPSASCDGKRSQVAPVAYFDPEEDIHSVLSKCFLLLPGAFMFTIGRKTARKIEKIHTRSSLAFAPAHAIFQDFVSEGPGADSADFRSLRSIIASSIPAASLHQEKSSAQLISGKSDVACDKQTPEHLSVRPLAFTHTLAEKFLTENRTFSDKEGCSLTVSGLPSQRYVLPYAEEATDSVIFYDFARLAVETFILLRVVEIFFASGLYPFITSEARLRSSEPRDSPLSKPLDSRESSSKSLSLGAKSCSSEPPHTSIPYLVSNVHCTSLLTSILGFGEFLMELLRFLSLSKDFWSIFKSSLDVDTGVWCEPHSRDKINQSSYFLFAFSLKMIGFSLFSLFHLIDVLFKLLRHDAFAINEASHIHQDDATRKHETLYETSLKVSPAYVGYWVKLCCLIATLDIIQPAKTIAAKLILTPLLDMVLNGLAHSIQSSFFEYAEFIDILRILSLWSLNVGRGTRSASKPLPLSRLLDNSRRNLEGTCRLEAFNHQFHGVGDEQSSSEALYEGFTAKTPMKNDEERLMFLGGTSLEEGFRSNPMTEQMSFFNKPAEKSPQSSVCSEKPTVAAYSSREYREETSDTSSSASKGYNGTHYKASKLVLHPRIVYAVSSMVLPISIAHEMLASTNHTADEEVKEERKGMLAALKIGICMKKMRFLPIISEAPGLVFEMIEEDSSVLKALNDPAPPCKDDSDSGRYRMMNKRTQMFDHSDGVAAESAKESFYFLVFDWAVNQFCEESLKKVCSGYSLLTGSALTHTLSSASSEVASGFFSSSLAEGNVPRREIQADASQQGFRSIPPYSYGRKIGTEASHSLPEKEASILNPKQAFKLEDGAQSVPEYKTPIEAMMVCAIKQGSALLKREQKEVNHLCRGPVVSHSTTFESWLLSLASPEDSSLSLREKDYCLSTKAASLISTLSSSPEMMSSSFTSSSNKLSSHLKSIVEGSSSTFSSDAFPGSNAENRGKLRDSRYVDEPCVSLFFPREYGSSGSKLAVSEEADSTAFSSARSLKKKGVSYCEEEEGIPLLGVQEAVQGLGGERMQYFSEPISPKAELFPLPPDMTQDQSKEKGEGACIEASHIAAGGSFAYAHERGFRNRHTECALEDESLHKASRPYGGSQPPTELLRSERCSEATHTFGGPSSQVFSENLFASCAKILYRLPQYIQASLPPASIFSPGDSEKTPSVVFSTSSHAGGKPFEGERGWGSRTNAMIEEGILLAGAYFGHSVSNEFFQDGHLCLRNFPMLKMLSSTGNAGKLRLGGEHGKVKGNAAERREGGDSATMRRNEGDEMVPDGCVNEEFCLLCKLFEVETKIRAEQGWHRRSNAAKSCCYSEDNFGLEFGKWDLHHRVCEDEEGGELFSQKVGFFVREDRLASDSNVVSRGGDEDSYASSMSLPELPSACSEAQTLPPILKRPCGDFGEEREVGVLSSSSLYSPDEALRLIQEKLSEGFHSYVCLQLCVEFCLTSFVFLFYIRLLHTLAYHTSSEDGSQRVLRSNASIYVEKLRLALDRRSFFLGCGENSNGEDGGNVSATLNFFNVINLLPCVRDVCEGSSMPSIDQSNPAAASNVSLPESSLSIISRNRKFPGGADSTGSFRRVLSSSSSDSPRESEFSDLAADCSVEEAAGVESLKKTFFSHALDKGDEVCCVSLPDSNVAAFPKSSFLSSARISGSEPADESGGRRSPSMLPTGSLAEPSKAADMRLTKASSASQSEFGEVGYIEETRRVFDQSISPSENETYRGACVLSKTPVNGVEHSSEDCQLIAEDSYQGGLKDEDLVRLSSSHQGGWKDGELFELSSCQKFLEVWLLLSSAQRPVDLRVLVLKIFSLLKRVLCVRFDTQSQTLEFSKDELHSSQNISASSHAAKSADKASSSLDLSLFLLQEEGECQNLLKTKDSSLSRFQAGDAHDKKIFERLKDLLHHEKGQFEGFSSFFMDFLLGSASGVQLMGKFIISRYLQFFGTDDLPLKKSPTHTFEGEEVGHEGGAERLNRGFSALLPDYTQHPMVSSMRFWWYLRNLVEISFARFVEILQGKLPKKANKLLAHNGVNERLKLHQTFMLFLNEIASLLAIFSDFEDPIPSQVAEAYIPRNFIEIAVLQFAKFFSAFARNLCNLLVITKASSSKLGLADDSSPASLLLRDLHFLVKRGPLNDLHSLQQLLLKVLRELQFASLVDSRRSHTQRAGGIASQPARTKSIFWKAACDCCKSIDVFSSCFQLKDEFSEILSSCSLQGDCFSMKVYPEVEERYQQVTSFWKKKMGVAMKKRDTTEEPVKEAGEEGEAALTKFPRGGNPSFRSIEEENGKNDVFSEKRLHQQPAKSDEEDGKDGFFSAKRLHQQKPLLGGKDVIIQTAKSADSFVNTISLSGDSLKANSGPDKVVNEEKSSEPASTHNTIDLNDSEEFFFGSSPSFSSLSSLPASSSSRGAFPVSSSSALLSGQLEAKVTTKIPHNPSSTVKQDIYKKSPENVVKLTAGIFSSSSSYWSANDAASSTYATAYTAPYTTPYTTTYATTYAANRYTPSNAPHTTATTTKTTLSSYGSGLAHITASQPDQLAHEISSSSHQSSTLTRPSSSSHMAAGEKTSSILPIALARASSLSALSSLPPQLRSQLKSSKAFHKKGTVCVSSPPYSLASLRRPAKKPKEDSIFSLLKKCGASSKRKPPAIPPLSVASFASSLPFSASFSSSAREYSLRAPSSSSSSMMGSSLRASSSSSGNESSLLHAAANEKTFDRSIKGEDDAFHLHKFPPKSSMHHTIGSNWSKKNNLKLLKKEQPKREETLPLSDDKQCVQGPRLDSYLTSKTRSIGFALDASTHSDTSSNLDSIDSKQKGAFMRNPKTSRTTQPLHLSGGMGFFERSNEALKGSKSAVFGRKGTQNDAEALSDALDISRQIDMMINELLNLDFLAMLEGPAGNSVKIANQKPLPKAFKCVEEYVRLFKPLALDECRAVILNSVFTEGIEVTVNSLKSVRSETTWLKTYFSRSSNSLSPADNNRGAFSFANWESQANYLVLLIPYCASVREVRRNGCKATSIKPLIDLVKSQGYLLGLTGKMGANEKAQTMDRATIEIKIPSSASSSFTGNVDSSSQNHKLKASAMLFNSTPSWIILGISELTSSIREFEGLYRSRRSSFFRYILNPMSMPINTSDTHQSSYTGEASSVSSSKEEVEKLKISCSNFLRALESSFLLNLSQKEAILKSLTVKEQVSLIQGPPGTGKTRTIVGLIAAVYRLIMQEKRAADRQKLEVSATHKRSKKDEMLDSNLGSSRFSEQPPTPPLKSPSSLRKAGKYKVLVCAPSNTAVDEILSRIYFEGLPNVRQEDLLFRKGHHRRSDAVESEGGGRNFIANDSLEPKCMKIGILSKTALDLQPLVMTTKSPKLESQLNTLTSRHKAQVDSLREQLNELDAQLQILRKEGASSPDDANTSIEAEFFANAIGSSPSPFALKSDHPSSFCNLRGQKIENRSHSSSYSNSGSIGVGLDRSFASSSPANLNDSFSLKSKNTSNIGSFNMEMNAELNAAFGMVEGSSNASNTSSKGVQLNPKYYERFRSRSNVSQLNAKKRVVYDKIKALQQTFQSEKKNLKHAGAMMVLEDVDLVFCTLSSSAKKVLDELEFECIIVDEAAQAIELSTLIPLRLKAKRFILVGDPQQLPSTVLSPNLKSTLYSRSLFERLQSCGCHPTLLNVQYRMRPEISAFPSKIFYDGMLIDDESVKKRKKASHEIFFPDATGTLNFFHVPSMEGRWDLRDSHFPRENYRNSSNFDRGTRKSLASPHAGNLANYSMSDTPSSVRDSREEFSKVNVFEAQFIILLLELLVQYYMLFDCLPRHPDNLDVFSSRKRGKEDNSSPVNSICRKEGFSPSVRHENHGVVHGAADSLTTAKKWQKMGENGGISAEFGSNTCLQPFPYVSSTAADRAKSSSPMQLDNAERMKNPHTLGQFPEKCLKSKDMMRIDPLSAANMHNSARFSRQNPGYNASLNLEKKQAEVMDRSSCYLIFNDIAIVTPYKSQMQEIQDQFYAKFGIIENIPEICSVDSMQGKEKKIVIFSCVRASMDSGLKTLNLPVLQKDDIRSKATDTTSGANGTNESMRESLCSTKILEESMVTDISQWSTRNQLGFLADTRRLNTAITRAKNSLWIVGNVPTLLMHPVWAKFLKFLASAPSKDCYFTDIAGQPSTKSHDPLSQLYGNGGKEQIPQPPRSRREGTGMLPNNFPRRIIVTDEKLDMKYIPEHIDKFFEALRTRFRQETQH